MSDLQWRAWCWFEGRGWYSDQFKQIVRWPKEDRWAWRQRYRAHQFGQDPKNDTAMALSA